MNPNSWYTDTAVKALHAKLASLNKVREAHDDDELSVQRQNLSHDLLEELTHSVIAILQRIHKDDTGKELELPEDPDA